jgi:hypothetical protein
LDGFYFSRFETDLTHGLAVTALDSSPHVVVSGKSADDDGVTLISVDPSKPSRSSSSLSKQFSPLSSTAISSPSTPSTLESMHDQLVKAFSELNVMEAPMKTGLPPRLDTGKYSIGYDRSAVHRWAFPLISPSSSIVVEFPKVWISKWVDYSNKYGLGFQMTDGTVGVHFNDSTVIMMASDER